MSQAPSVPADAAGVLRLLRSDRAAAAEAVAALDTEGQVALICGAPVQQRHTLLDLLPAPERVIALLPEAELCFTVKAIGLESAVWVLDHATPEQVAAAIDLDVWRDHAPHPAQLDAWLDALAETGDESLLRAITHLDAELVVHWLQNRILVAQKPSDDEDWEPPDGSQTLDGQFHFAQLRSGDDAASIRRALTILWNGDYWTYFRLMLGVIHELPTENQEWALRWRNARLQDLGFPPWDEAMRLYRHLRSHERTRLPADARPLDVETWRLPVWLPQLPESAEGAHLVFRAITKLDAEERTAAFYAFVAVANAVAVADRMPLSDTETTPRAIAKAARWIDRGLEHIADSHGLEHVDVLRRVALEHLFRVGANLDPEAARPPPREDPEEPHSDA
ncbi:MAG: hypothetical protein JRH16_01490 [Deltaproteobacteria bacterium]|nr:hypothetical protein [Deltaproteobacteria bacterium]MBW2359491.1 hypothetical protein [Deltaproteobacteria bacterium]